MGKTKNHVAPAGATGYGFGAFQGVFTPSILTIIGVVMYLRFGWMLGNLGLAASLAIVTAGSAITLLTGLSISALATNMRMKGGGAYFMLSRSLGLEAGAALGIPLALSQAIGVSFYVVGFAEALVQSGIPVFSGVDPHIVGMATLAALAAVSTFSADIALKSQYLVMAAIAASLVSFFLGGPPPAPSAPIPETPLAGFWPVFAVFFPAVTGILSGVGMSGDLKDPGKAIPRGTVAAVLVGYAIYMSVPVALAKFVPDAAWLRADSMLLQKCARWPYLVLAGVWAATLSSAVGSFLAAPRVVQALARDRILPGFLGRGFGNSDDPRFAAAACFALAAACVWVGDINMIAPVLTLFNLSTYGLLNLSAACEELMSNPTWRPTFRVKATLSFAGFAGCLVAMFMISPGWTFVALVCESGIYWLVKRRALRAQWGDMRTGLWTALARLAFRKLSRGRHLERNWRPNILVLTDLPIRNLRLLRMARSLSGGRGLVTIGSAVPQNAWSPEREEALKDSVLHTARKTELETEVKIVPSADDWAGMSNMVCAYGFGPILPNTIVMGMPSAESAENFSTFMKLASLHRRNIIMADRRETPDNGGCVDIWWRGANANGAFMLALAFMLKRDEAWRERPLRVNMIVSPGQSRESAEEQLAAFLEDARIEAKTRVIDGGGEPFVETIAKHSSDAAMTFVGLRLPNPDEAKSSFGDYVCSMRDGLSQIACPIFAMASEAVDFKRIFS
ncbi:MAG: Na-K-Cl cotransporter [Kiritimatiellae bacterium]|nr:Na-K-Cl cotransporter [Kiritimatiellia bacterium]